MDCTWILNIIENGELTGTESFTDFDALRNEIADKFDITNESDVIKSKDLSQEDAIKRLKELKSTTRIKRATYSKNKDELYDIPDNEDYIELHLFIEGGKKIDGMTPFTEPYDPEKLASTLKNENKLTDEEIKKLFESFERTETRAYYLHILLNNYFNDTTSRTLEGIKRVIRSTFPSEILDEWLKSDAMLSNFLSLLLKVRNKILTLTGVNVEHIIPNVSLTADLNGTSKKLYVNIDLVAIDSYGVPHVFLFKSSAKNELELPDVKRQKRDYYLGAIRQVLALKGYNIKNMTLNIVPVLFFENDDTTLKEIAFGEIVDRTIALRRDKSSRLDPYVGEIWRDLNNLIPVTLNEADFNGVITHDVTSKVLKLFPTHNIVLDSRSRKVTNFIKKYVVISTKPGMSYEFLDRHGNIYYVKESSPAETNTELREKVAKVIDAEKKADINKLGLFLRKIQNVINNHASLTSISSNSSSAGRISMALNKYATDDWEYKALPKLEALGIGAFQNKNTGQIDFIILTGEDNLNDTINLGFGNTILGAFKKNHLISGKVKLLATQGNIKFMELLVALDECWSELKDEHIGELKVMNPFTGNTLSIQNSMLIADYKQLCKEAGVTTNIAQLEKAFISDIENLKNHVITTLGHVAISDLSLLHTIQERIEKLLVLNRLIVAEECMKIIQLITADKSPGEFLKDGYANAISAVQGDKLKLELLNLYLIILQTYMYAKGDWYGIQEMQTIGQASKNTLFNGSMTVTADVIPYRNEANLTNSALQSFQKIRRTFVHFKDDFFENHVKKLWKDKGYSQSQNLTLGNLSILYRNLFEEKDGKLNPNLVFKNPDTDTTLSDTEKKFLRKVLWIINRRRWGLESYSESSPEVQKEKQKRGLKWYWVPIQEAAAGSKLNRDHLEDTIKLEFKEIVSFGKEAKEVFRREEANVYTESEYEAFLKAELRNKIFIRYTESDDDLYKRTLLLQSKPLGFWETNVENIVLQHELTYIRRDELDKLLPHIAVAKFLIEAWGNLAGLDTSVNLDYLDNFVKLSIHNVTLLSALEKENTHLIRKAKMAASYSMIVGNVFAPIRDVLDGLWKGIGIFVGDTWGEGKGFTKADYIDAYKVVIKDSTESLAGVTLLESLNAAFGISDMDYAQLARKTKSGKVGLFNFKDKLFWTTTAGDYTNRMVILIAKMKHDGCFDACSYENGLKYNMKKDKRFSTWDGTKCTDSKLQGLYLSMLRDFNEAGYNLKEGDALPEPYAPKEIVALKSFADRLYGYYDHELRIQAEKHALGSLFLQFSTYLTANKTQWFLSPKEYETNVRKQATDADGNLLFWKRVIDVNGEESLIPVPESELEPNDPREPVMDVAKSYMEGIFYTLRDFCRDTKNLGLIGAWKNVQDCDAKRQNLRLLAYKLLMWAILGGIVKTLLSMWKENRKKDKSPYTLGRAISDEGFNMVYRAINGSADNFNLLNVFGGNIMDSEVPAYATAANFVKSTWKAGKNIVTGNEVGKSLDAWIYTNSAAYRSTSGLWRGLLKMSEATNNSLA